jgi:hypothetical protein
MATLRLAVRSIFIIASVLALVLFPAHDASAAFHLFEVTEVYTSADGEVQYFELATSSNSQHLMAGHVFRSNSDGVIKTFTMPSDLPSSATANKSFIIATPAFQAASGIAPDYVLPCGAFFNRAATSITIELVGADAVTFAGSSLPESTTSSLHFTVDGVASVASATPKNFANATGAMTSACIGAGTCPSSCDNTPPEIIAGDPVVMCQNTSVSITIATVSDAQDEAESLTVEAVSDDPGLTITNIVNAGGTVTATLTADGTVTDGTIVTLSVTDSGDLTDAATLAVAFTENDAPALGTYGGPTADDGGWTTIVPSAPPTDDGPMTLYISGPPEFDGIALVNSENGVVSIRDIGPAGDHYFEVVGTDECGTQVTAGFVLTVYNTQLSAPSNFVVYLATPSSASLSWNPVELANLYRIHRRSPTSGGWVTVGNTGTTSFTDSALPANSAFVYAVEARYEGDGVARSALSRPGWVTTHAFTDNPPIVGSTKVKAQHLNETRAAATSLNAAVGLATPAWIDPSLTGARIKEVHVTQLAAVIHGAMHALTYNLPAISETIVAGTTPVRKSHLANLRFSLGGYCTPGSGCQ